MGDPYARALAGMGYAVYCCADRPAPRKASQRYSAPSAQLRVIEGAGHGFYGEDETIALHAIAGYLDARLHREPMNGKPANKKSRGENEKRVEKNCPIKEYSKQTNKQLLIGK